MSGQAADKPVKAAFCAPTPQPRPNGEWHPESDMQYFTPDPKRTQSTGTRGLSITLRTLHLASFGILLGGHAFGIESDRLRLALYFTIGSGIGLVALEIYITGPYWLLLGKGMMVLLKLLVLLAVPALWEYRLPLLLLVVVLASVGSHMPARYRHYSFLHGRTVQASQLLSIAPSKKETSETTQGHG